jgi:AcrR family transcriptional regulator
MKTRRDRILDVAISLAEAGGFDNVRQRDVAEQAGVALGTLYKAFRTKEDLLSAALERETQLLEQRMESSPPKGKTAVDRVGSFFQLVTRGLCKKPRYARAVLRAMTSGEPEVTRNVVAYQGRMNRLILAALRGQGPISEPDVRRRPPSDEETTLTLLLQQLWFAELVAWSASMVTPNQVIQHMHTAAEVLTRGLKGYEPRPARSRPTPRTNGSARPAPRRRRPTS